MLQITTEKIMSSDKTRKRNVRAGNKALKVSATDGAACSLACREHSIRENEATRSKIFKRSDVRFPIDSCNSQGTDTDYHKMKSANLPGNLEEVYQKKTRPGYHSLQKSEEYRENENVCSLNSSSLQKGKKRRRKRGGKRHNRCKKATSQDSPPPTAADNSGLMTFLSENCTSGLKPEEQRKKQDQNKAPMANLVLVNKANRSEPFGVNLEDAIEKSCELGTNILDSTFENQYELAKSNLVCTNMVRNGLQEQDLACSSNSRDSHLAVEYMEKLKLVFSPGKSLGFPKKKLLILDLNGLLADINEDYHNAHMADAKVRRKLGEIFSIVTYNYYLAYC